MDESNNQELEMLRAFYDRWIDLHTTARTEANRPILELMAQNLVDAGHAIAQFRKGQKVH